MSRKEGGDSMQDFLPNVQGCYYENILFFVGFSAVILGFEPYLVSYCSFVMYEDCFDGGFIQYNGTINKGVSQIWYGIYSCCYYSKIAHLAVIV